jgi:hypothetical protein
MVLQTPTRGIKWSLHYSDNHIRWGKVVENGKDVVLKGGKRIIPIVNQT